MSARIKRPRPRRKDEMHEKRQDILLNWSNEVCNSEEVPEVEIVSLLQEHIPKYRLRADSITQFGGYENQDWFIPSPALPVKPEDLALTPDQIRETLNYFLLCSNRVSQMTKTYNDIEAVTRLLEEKEKDLELTARIGKELLTTQGLLESRVSSLEGDLRIANDQITQLRHDLSIKTDLLQVLTNDTEEPLSPTEQEAACAAALRKRTGALERENRALREEATRLAAGADSAELAEQQLLRDIAHQLSSANSEASVLGSELFEERQRASDLQYQLDSVNARLTVSERNYQQLTADHEHTLRILDITRDNQNALAGELADYKILTTLNFLATGSYQKPVGSDWFAPVSQPTASRCIQEVAEALNELLPTYIKFPVTEQEKNKIKQGFYEKCGMPGVMGCIDGTLVAILAPRSHPSEAAFFSRKGYHAINAAIERYAEIAAHLAEAQDQLRQLRKRGEPTRGLMPSVAAAAGLLPASLHREMHSSVYSELSLDSGIGDPLAHSSMQKVFETVQCASRWSNGSGPSLPGSDVADGPPALPTYLIPPPKPLSHDSFLDDSSDAESDDLYPGGCGVGVPGAPGAAELAAALRRLTPQEINSRRASLAASHVLRQRRHTERDVSEESAVWGAGAAGGFARFRAPHKLQIVKPMEGSLTLHTWAQLAKPNMSGLLEEHEGVGVRGVRSAAALGLRTYRLSDVEEDDDMLRLPHSSLIYTFTNSVEYINSTVLHPNDGSLVGSGLSSVAGSGMSSLSSSVLGSAWSSRMTSRRSSAAVSPERSRRDSLVTPPSRPHWSPTATPANSPLLGSPDSSPPATPRPGDAPPSLHALIASGTSILRRRHLGAGSPAGEGSPAPLALQTPGSLYTGLVHRSPMEQLTCLKRTLRSPAAPPQERVPSDTCEPPLGVPAPLGSGALDGSPENAGCSRRTRGRTPRPRTDLGTVEPKTTNTPSAAHTSPLGTLSLLFGRKGGYL